MLPVDENRQLAIITVQISDAICSQCCLTRAAHNYTRAVNQVAARKQNLVYSAISSKFRLAFRVVAISYLCTICLFCFVILSDLNNQQNVNWIRFFITMLVCPCIMWLMFINIFVVAKDTLFSLITFLLHNASLCILSPKSSTMYSTSFHVIFLCNSSATALWFDVSIFWCQSSDLFFTYADDVHEAVHAVADLEEQVLTLPLGRGAEGGPDEPGDAGNEEQGTQNNGSYLHLFYHRQRDGLPLESRKKYSDPLLKLDYHYHNVKIELYWSPGSSDMCWHNATMCKQHFSLPTVL